MSRQAIIHQQIDAAFRDLPYPGNENLVDAPNDHWSADVATGYRGRRWQDLTAEDVRVHCDDLPLLTPAAFRYFLPAHMIQCVLAPLEVNTAVTSTVYCLTPTHERVSASEWWSRRTEILDVAQCRAVLEFIRYADEKERDDWAKIGRILTSTAATKALAWWTERVARLSA